MLLLIHTLKAVLTVLQNTRQTGATLQAIDTSPPHSEASPSSKPLPSPDTLSDDSLVASSSGHQHQHIPTVSAHSPSERELALYPELLLLARALSTSAFPSTLPQSVDSPEPIHAPEATSNSETPPKAQPATAESSSFGQRSQPFLLGMLTATAMFQLRARSLSRQQRRKAPDVVDVPPQHLRPERETTDDTNGTLDVPTTPANTTKTNNCVYDKAIVSMPTVQADEAGSSSGGRMNLELERKAAVAWQGLFRGWSALNRSQRIGAVHALLERCQPCFRVTYRGYEAALDMVPFHADPGRAKAALLAHKHLVHVWPQLSPSDQGVHLSGLVLPGRFDIQAAPLAEQAIVQEERGRQREEEEDKENCPPGPDKGTGKASAIDVDAVG
ncbi:hypothetical protein FB45DRAFT_946308 [Roridomyces roridus]|uniref:Uncharacterized protein n=1 Tax=Roridomyces roridus TaxID=1738132 RepID=A0AAD7B3C1_9AGAR|nr:hypothetical protein FB45DRAFT_946308 [Roridomyces roridus]